MKILIPTKLDKAAAGALTAAGYEVVQNDSIAIDELATANPDAQFLVLFFIPVKAWVIALIDMILIGSMVFNQVVRAKHVRPDLTAPLNFFQFSSDCGRFFFTLSFLLFNEF